MPNSPKTQILTTRDNRLRVRFVWKDDRFGHLIELNSVGDWHVVAESTEGTSDDFWPASPPFQQVESHVISGDTQCLLAVGLSGSSHWSASIEEIHENVPHTAIRFDIACRMKKADGQLGSSYHVEPGQPVEIVTSSIVSTEARSVNITPNANPSDRSVTARWAYDFVIN